jgi:hypothetical protein
MAGKVGRPRKRADSKRSVHFGLKVTESEYKLLVGIVDSENRSLERDGYEPTATTANTVRKLIKEEAKRRGLLPRPPSENVGAG